MRNDEKSSLRHAPSFVLWTYGELPSPVLSIQSAHVDCGSLLSGATMREFGVPLPLDPHAADVRVCTEDRTSVPPCMHTVCQDHTFVTEVTREAICA